MWFALIFCPANFFQSIQFYILALSCNPTVILKVYNIWFMNSWKVRHPSYNVVALSDPRTLVNLNSRTLY
jgi:hypothetical protein